jgi:hypothetical protein
VAWQSVDSSFASIRAIAAILSTIVAYNQLFAAETPVCRCFESNSLYQLRVHYGIRQRDSPASRRVTVLAAIVEGSEGNPHQRYCHMHLRAIIACASKYKIV